MIVEDVRTRRGEPVIVVDDEGRERLGTIEFGGEGTDISVYCERDGHSTGRVVVRDAKRVRSDPGGDRPCWKRVSGG